MTREQGSHNRFTEQLLWRMKQNMRLLQRRGDGDLLLKMDTPNSPLTRGEIYITGCERELQDVTTTTAVIGHWGRALEWRRLSIGHFCEPTKTNGLFAVLWEYPHSGYGWPLDVHILLLLLKYTPTWKVVPVLIEQRSVRFRYFLQTYPTILFWSVVVLRVES